MLPRLLFEGGTVILEGVEQEGVHTPEMLRWDDRRACYRTHAHRYAEVVLWLRSAGIAYTDEARAYASPTSPEVTRQQPFPHQQQALDAWIKNQRRGVIVLPTGSGKTFVAVMAIDERPRSSLIVVPTLDLLHQWYDLLEAAFACPIGIIGGGYHELCTFTVTTYDSAYIHMDRLGNRFGLVVFDECHHLPSESYAMAARCCLAPFRMGLTATPERADGGEARYEELIGPVVYRKDIDELSGKYLADYETQRIEVSLTEPERAEHDRERGLYLTFLRKHRINMSRPSGWSDFIILCSRSEEGRRAFLAYRRQKQLALTATRKLDVLERLLHAHRRDRAIVFTQDNATVYDIAKRYLLPVITHQTKVKERGAILRAFNSGALGVVVTSKVLNEGVDVPEANVAIVLSGSGSVREHVQRLGRILRKREGKRAILYELVSIGTSEERTSAKRREHRAYQ